MTTALDPQQLGATAVAMALFGAVVGITVRKVARLLVLVVAVQLACYRYLESKGLVEIQVGTVGPDVAYSGLGGIGEATTATVLSTGAVGLSFAVGFAVGLSRT
jgi:uncharacterized membrane protein (Fun14 family)